MRALDDPAETVRDAAVAALAAAGPPGAEAAVRALADPRRAGGALRALERSPVRPPEGAVRRYVDARATAADTDLDRARGLAPVDGAVRLLRDSLVDRARRAALDGLRAGALLDGGAAVRTALDDLTGREPARVAVAIEALDALGRGALLRPWEPVVPRPGRHGETLAALAHDPDPWIRHCAHAAAPDPYPKDRECPQ